MSRRVRAYFNEFDPGAAEWLRELIREGLLPDGEVDERDIREVQAADLKGFVQCHFFAGIGGWALALRLAGWPESVPVWTGSCPCQPFSTAGRRQGVADERHVWPDFFRLIAESRPPVVFGEQVAGAGGLAWLDGVFADLEGAGYACGAANLCAAGEGAPHIRQRLFWVADAPVRGTGQHGDGPDLRPREAGQDGQRGGGLADTTDGGRPDTRTIGNSRGQSGARLGCQYGRMGDPIRPGRKGRGPGVRGRPVDCRSGESASETSDAGFWSDHALVPCRDGKARRTQPGLFPLADGIPGRVGLLRGAGNAIVPQVAAAFVQAYREARG